MSAKSVRQHPAVQKVLAVLDAVGLNYSSFTGRVNSPQGVGILLEGGVDPLKAEQVPAFAEKIAKQSGMTNQAIAQASLREGRRALVVHVVNTLVHEHSATLLQQENHHGETVDERHTFQIDGLVVNLILMTH